jgi:hypothetical protein
MVSRWHKKKFGDFQPFQEVIVSGFVFRRQRITDDESVLRVWNGDDEVEPSPPAVMLTRDEALRWLNGKTTKKKAKELELPTVFTLNTRRKKY